MNAIELSSNTLDLAARILDGEAEGEPDDGKAAIAWVMRNRAEWQPAAWWGHDIHAVCSLPAQFSCLGGGKNTERIMALPITNPYYLKAADILVAVMDGTIPDPTGGATTYKVRGTKASWDHAIQDMVPRSIGKHDFWRLAPNGICLPFSDALPEES